MRWFVPVVMVTAVLAGVAQAQPASDVETLRTQIAALQRQLDVLKAQVEALGDRASTPGPQQVPAPATPPPGPQALEAIPITRRVSPAIQQRQVLKGDPEAVARLDNAPLDPDLAGFIDIPNTRTQIRFGGNAKLDVIHDFSPAGEPDAFITSTIPVGEVPDADNTSLSARQSRVSIDLRRATGRGDLRVFYENDFLDFSSGRTQFTLRHLYGQVANVLAGYTYSTLMDVDSMPDTLDYEGPGNMVYLSQPVVRYTFGLDPGRRQTLAVALEKGQSDIVETVADQPITITPTAPVPDFHARYRFDGETGHLQVGTVLRSVGGYTDTLAEKHVFGYGLSVSGSKQVRGTDYLLFQGNFGRGMGRYLQDVTGLAADVGVDADGKVVANDAAGYHVAFQHYWNDSLRSTATYGLAWIDSKGKTLTTAFNRSDYAAANVIWNPEDTSFNIGVEYLWGWQTLSTGEKGNASRLQVSFQYDLVR